MTASRLSRDLFVTTTGLAVPALPVALSEAAFQRVVIDLATWRGWKTYHVHDSRRSAAGWPDLILVRADRLLAVELKSQRGRVSTSQAAWLDALGLVPGIQAFIWRPTHWPEIQAALR